MTEDKSSIGHLPEKDKWEFDESVTEVFNDMLLKSIPNYLHMRDLVFDIGKEFVKHGTEIVDIGASRGDAVKPFVKRFGAHNTYQLIEISKPMRDAIHQNYKGYIDSGIMEVRDTDLRYDEFLSNASLVLSVLTMMFIPVEYRFKVLTNIYESLIGGGCLIMVEKILYNNPLLSDKITNLYHSWKHSNGYSEEEITRKKYSLEGVLVSLTEKSNLELLKNSGFKHVESFWKSYNFCGWIAIK